MNDITKEELIEALTFLTNKLKTEDITIEESSVKYDIKSSMGILPAYNCTLIDLPGNRAIELKIIHRDGI